MPIKESNSNYWKDIIMLGRMQRRFTSLFLGLQSLSYKGETGEAEILFPKNVGDHWFTLKIYKVMRRLDKVNGHSLSQLIRESNIREHRFTLRGELFKRDPRGNFFHRGK